MPSLTVVRPCGNGTSPLDQTIVGDGKPKARQETEATESAFTFITLSGISVNCGGTGKVKQIKKNLSTLRTRR